MNINIGYSRERGLSASLTGTAGGGALLVSEEVLALRQWLSRGRNVLYISILIFIFVFFVAENLYNTGTARPGMTTSSFSLSPIKMTC